MTDRLGNPVTPHQFAVGYWPRPELCGVCQWAESHVVHNYIISPSVDHVREAIARYPRTFQLSASAIPFGDRTDSFRIDKNASYRNDAGDVQLVLERLVNGQWLQYGKVYPAELDDHIVKSVMDLSDDELLAELEDVPALPDVKLRLLRFPVNCAWAFVFGSHTDNANMCQLYGYEMFYQTKGEAIEAAKQRGLDVDLKSFVVSVSPLEPRSSLFLRDDEDEAESIPCDSCQALMINGVFCHETGCPNSGARYDVESQSWVKQYACRECGQKVDKGETCCEP